VSCTGWTTEVLCRLRGHLPRHKELFGTSSECRFHPPSRRLFQEYSLVPRNENSWGMIILGMRILPGPRGKILRAPRSGLANVLGPGRIFCVPPRAWKNSWALGESSAYPAWAGGNRLFPGEFPALSPWAGKNRWGTGVPIIAPHTNGT